MRKLYVFVFFNIILLNLFSQGLKYLNDEEYIKLIEKYVTSNKLTLKTIGDLRYVIINENDTVRYFILSSDYSQVRGYHGVTTLGIVLNKDMKVHHVQIVDSQDTRAYISRINAMGFMQRLVGYGKGDQVELVTGATITAKAIIQTINESVERFKTVLNN